LHKYIYGFGQLISFGNAYKIFLDFWLEQELGEKLYFGCKTRQNFGNPYA